MSKQLRAALTLLTIIVDASMAGLAFASSYYVRATVPFPTPLDLGPFSAYLPALAVHVISLVVTFFIYRLYHTRRGASRIDLFYTILSAVSIATVISTALSYLTYQGDRELSRGVTVYNWALSLLYLLAGRVFLGAVWRLVLVRRPERLLLVGTSDAARMILQKTLHSPHLGYRVVGFVTCDGTAPDPPANGVAGVEAGAAPAADALPTGSEEGARQARPRTEIAGVPVLGAQSELASIVREHDISEVVIATPDATHEDLLDMISACEAEHAGVRIFPDLFQIVASEMSIGDLDGLPMITVRDSALRGWRRAIKRIMDVVVSAVGLVVLSPFMLLVALLIKLTSKGPVFYSQVRVGLDGKPFPVLKFRTMRVDAEATTGPVWATANDPRRTRLGDILRRTSIDELPQLVNVLVGEMSLVGPRPERPYFVEQFKQVVPRYMERHKEKAGLTGWAQVNGLRGDTSIVERTKYDLYYIENWSLLFDIKILLRTLANVLRGDRHAY